MKIIRCMYFLAFLVLLSLCENDDIECFLPKHMKSFIFSDGEKLIYKSNTNDTDTFIVSINEGVSSTCIKWEEDGNEEDDYSYYSCSRCERKLFYESLSIVIYKMGEDKCIDSTDNEEGCNTSFNIYSRCDQDHSSTTIGLNPYGIQWNINGGTKTYDIYNVPVYYILKLSSDITVNFNYEYGIIRYELSNGEYWELQN